MKTITLITFMAIFLSILYTMYRRHKDQTYEERKRKYIFWREWEIKNEKMRKQYSQRVKKEFERMKIKHGIN